MGCEFAKPSEPKKMSSWADIPVDDDEDGFTVVKRKKSNKKTIPLHVDDFEPSMLVDEDPWSSPVWELVRSNPYCVELVHSLPSDEARLAIFKAFEHYDENKLVHVVEHNPLLQQINQASQKKYKFLKAFKSVTNWYLKLAATQ
jgi:hypothetical protein